MIQTLFNALMLLLGGRKGVQPLLLKSKTFALDNLV